MELDALPERRQHDRAPLKMLVQFKSRDMDEFMREYATDLSAGGMFIRTSEPLLQGTNVYFQFRLDDGDILIEGLGQVMHVNAPKETSPGMGLEFINLDPTSKALIDDIIKARIKESTATPS